MLWWPIQNYLFGEASIQQSNQQKQIDSGEVYSKYDKELLEIVSCSTRHITLIYNY